MCRLSSRGFTLIEVLVATIILALGLLGALTTFSMASRATAASSRDTVICALAQERLAEVRALARVGRLPTGTSNGDFGERYPGYSWRVVVSEPDELHVRRVELTIYQERPGRDYEARFVTEIF